MDLLLTAKGLVMTLAFVLTAGALTWFVSRWFAAIMDRPANGDGPVAKAGGIGLLTVGLPLIGSIVWLNDPANTVSWAVLTACLALAVVFGTGDPTRLPAIVRLTVQGAAVTVILILIPAKFLMFQGLLPLAPDRIAAAIIWLWFINTVRPMDAIDGVAGVETITIATGIFAISAAIGSQGGGTAAVTGFIALALIATAGGFLTLNWPPARVSLGEVGTITLGFLLGWLLITLAMWGYWVAALILPAYVLVEGAHRQNLFCARAIERGWPAGRVVWFIAGGNFMLLILAVVSTQVINSTGDMLCLAGAVLITAVMGHWLARAAPPADN
jgi:UDP-N-acetylmuramyl pentapeptide phosphotransferase/UDP-N-acetylglucosamine-1-phosphate transferase